MSNPLLAAEESADILQDYTFSRVTFYKLLQTGMESLEDLQELAKESEHPRAFEVFSGYMKNMADINEKLIQLQDKHFDLQAKRNKEDPTLIEHIETDSAKAIVFTGDTSEVLKVIENKDKEDGTETEDD